jgi:hypothetical protein
MEQMYLYPMDTQLTHSLSSLCHHFPALSGQAVDDMHTAVHHNAKVIDEGAVYRVIADILDSRMQDFEYLIKNNMNEIIAEAKKGR